MNEKIEELQKLARTPEIVKEIRQMVDNLDEVLKEEVIMWFQWSIALWLKDGDINCNFFHQKALFRKQRNIIKEIEDEKGRLCKKK